MASRRVQIREAIRQKLLNKTDAEGRVFSNLSSAYWSEQLPVICIFTLSEDVEVLNTAPREYRRSIEVAIEIAAQGSENPDGLKVTTEDQLDKISDQVELELNRDETLGEIIDAAGKTVALVDELILGSIEFEFRGEGVKPTGFSRLVYSVVYHEMRPGSLEEQDNIGTLEKVHVDWKVGHHNSPPDNVVEATDDLVIPD